MIVSNIIGGESVSEETFKVYAPFEKYPLQVILPRINENQMISMFRALNLADPPNLAERTRLVKTLGYYEPSDNIVANVSKMTGMPVKLIKEKIEDGKRISGNIVDLAEENDGKITSVAIGPNDPREYFFFLSHLLMAGSPAAVKLSAREPFLGYDMVNFLINEGLPPGMINVFYGDTRDKQESQLIAKLAKHVEQPIVMGDTKIVDHQLSFYAERSRALVLDAEAALPYLRYSVEWPGSCLAEHNYIVVGRDNFEKVLQGLKETYAALKEGDLINPETRLGLTEKTTLDAITGLVKIGQITDTLKVHYPSKGDELVTADDVRRGVIVEHYREDKEAGVNPIMEEALPAYISGIRCVDSLEDALEDLRFARDSFAQSTNNLSTKSMALGVYGDMPHNFKGDLSNLAYDVHYNESPVQVDGKQHQGIKLQEVLRK